MTKEQERAELHKTIWRIANDLRGSVDGWDFKSYVLGMLFYRFISENITQRANALVEAAEGGTFDYTRMADDEADVARSQMVSEIGYFILPSELFTNVQQRAAQDENLNITLGNIFAHIENSANGSDSEQDIKGLFSDVDTNSPKLGNTVAQRNEKLVKILNAIADLNLGSAFDQTVNDTFGDAYEFLMTMYASNAGKSGGEFFTPQEVSRLLAKIAIGDKAKIRKAYDPACGSGSLLLQFKKIMGDDCPPLYGQEINPTTYNLCRINMFCPIPLTASGGRGSRIPSSSTMSVLPLPGSWHRRARPTWPSPCTCSRGSPPMARRPSWSSPACSTAGAPSRRSEAI